MSTMTYTIWLAGAIHAGIVLANFSLPKKLQVRQNLMSVPRFLQQVFYVHWAYIVLIVALFAALCFGFARDLAGASPLGRFLSAFMAGFWLLRLVLQYLYYDREIRRQYSSLYAVYAVSLVALILIFGFAAIHPAG